MLPCLHNKNMSSERDNENCLGWATTVDSGFLSPYKFNRRREIVGIVTEVGPNVEGFEVGDHVGVGPYVNSCRDCEYCNERMEVQCKKRYRFRVPDSYTLALAAPLLCVGLTVFTPMKLHNMNQPGEEALNILGADDFVYFYVLDSRNSLDFIIVTASGDHPFDPYISLLKTAGIFVLVGFPSEVKFSPARLNLGMRTISGSRTGETKDTRELLDFCAANKIYPQVELVPIQYANAAIERLIKGDVRCRFVLDIENSLK
ncbi:Alcohol dehydrogenase, N-terminal [Dillenia turbinata]|uniref:Alcohol dehydrogenase, N-terminal n=1 Tax=Dillenia turbinata TaxID=194707 RepID=A0AAN8VRX5_9MAGN